MRFPLQISFIISSHVVGRFLAWYLVAVKKETHMPTAPITGNVPAALPDNHPITFAPKISVVLMNLGTPDGTDYWSVRRYLKEFLSDQRVIEIPKVIWWFILNVIILTFRPSKSGHAYASIWDREHDASPLRVITKAQTQELQRRLGDDVIVDYAMLWAAEHCQCNGPDDGARLYEDIGRAALPAVFGCHRSHCRGQDECLDGQAALAADGTGVAALL